MPSSLMPPYQPTEADLRASLRDGTSYAQAGASGSRQKRSRRPSDDSDDSDQVEDDDPGGLAGNDSDGGLRPSNPGVLPPLEHFGDAHLEGGNDGGVGSNDGDQVRWPIKFKLYFVKNILDVVKYYRSDMT
jgi:hypothetical protein